MYRIFSPKRVPFRKLSRSQVLSEAQDINRVPLSVPIPLSSTIQSPSRSTIVTPYAAEISTLDNGIRVASQEHFGDYCTIGLAIESGSRYEALHPPGTSHLVEKLAFGANIKQNSREEIYEVLERNGGLIDCQSTRDTFIYAASCHVDGLEEVLEVISNAVWRPKILDEEFEDSKAVVEFENVDMVNKIECEPLLTDWIHTAGFRSNTLGFSKYTKDEMLSRISKKDVFTFMSLYHRPERLVVAGIGVSHEQLKNTTKRLFDWNTTTWAQNPGVLHSKIPSIDNSIAQYTGGEIRVERDLSEIALGTPYPHLAHVVLGFEGCSYKDDDFVTMCVIQSLLGGGGSFSAGGPGKGMFTRLYTEVMNCCHWMYSCTAYNHSYADSGIFCINAAAPPEAINAALQLIFYQFLRLLDGADKEELNRAKTQLKSQLMMNLEIRPIMFEDLARQVIGHGRRRLPAEYMEKIDQVTSADIARVGQRLLSVKPSLVGYGVINELASYSQLEDAVAQRQPKLLEKKEKIFSWQ